MIGLIALVAFVSFLIGRCTMLTEFTYWMDNMMRPTKAIEVEVYEGTLRRIWKDGERYKIDINDCYGIHVHTFLGENSLMPITNDVSSLRLCHALSIAMSASNREKVFEQKRLATTYSDEIPYARFVITNMRQVGRITSYIFPTTVYRDPEDAEGQTVRFIKVIFWKMWKDHGSGDRISSMLLIKEGQEWQEVIERWK